MKISLLTDAPKHNLALMKLSAWHKANGDDVILNAPLFPADYTYASILFEKNKNLFIADEYGGAAFPDSQLLPEVEQMKPDYSLYNVNYSLGYTFRPCFNDCYFCKVPKMNHPDSKHHSIHEFYNSDFETICLLNNNTFQDPAWRKTFEEIWDLNLTVKDENGYDIRLLDEEKTQALKKTKFTGKIHFAWDRMQDEELILNGLRLLKQYKIYASFYVLTGYNTSLEQDIYRCQKITEQGHRPFIMPYKRTKLNMRFKDFIISCGWSRYETIQEAWDDLLPTSSRMKSKKHEDNYPPCNCLL